MMIVVARHQSSKERRWKGNDFFRDTWAFRSFPEGNSERLPRVETVRNVNTEVKIGHSLLVFHPEFQIFQEKIFGVF